MMLEITCILSSDQCINYVLGNFSIFYDSSVLNKIQKRRIEVIGFNLAERLLAADMFEK